MITASCSALAFPFFYFCVVHFILHNICLLKVCLVPPWIVDHYFAHTGMWVWLEIDYFPAGPTSISLNRRYRTDCPCEQAKQTCRGMREHPEIPGCCLCSLPRGRNTIVLLPPRADRTFERNMLPVRRVIAVFIVFLFGLHLPNWVMTFQSLIENLYAWAVPKSCM